MTSKKLLILETEMKGPRGHYLDNLIETYYFFEHDFDIYAALNNKFNDEGTFIPNTLSLSKILNVNNFEKKKNKILFIIYEIYSFLKRFILSIFLIPHFIYTNNSINYLNALFSNGFIIPRYFVETYFFLKKNKFSEMDNIFFPTTRNKHMSLANFLIRLNKDIPKIHLRLLYTPSFKKVGGFYYYFNKLNKFLMNNKVYFYVLTEKNFKILKTYNSSDQGIYLSNIPWVFFSRNKNNDYFTVGYMGDARISRGFNLLPELIEKILAVSDKFKFIIQYSKVDDSVRPIHEKLLKMSKNYSNIIIKNKYLDYKNFRDVLKSIDIMPILHNSEEINNGNPSTIYSSITHEIPMTLPRNLEYMKNILKHKSYVEADNLNETVSSILTIKDNYDNYLSCAKKNSLILHEVFSNDPLKKNIV